MKASAHAEITEIAAEMLASQGAGKLARLLGEDKYRKALCQGAKREDAPTLSRGLNWHFYPANEELRQADRDFLIWTLRPTSLFILGKRQAEVLPLLGNSSSRRLFTAMGRVLHHLQDMSTPSHVVPVYHGPKIADPFEDFLEERWPQLDAALKVELHRETLPAVSSGTDFVTLYRQAGQRLLSGLDAGQGLFPLAINGEGSRVDSTFFWRTYAASPSCSKIPFKIPGFGSFGPLGEQFGTCSSCRIEGKEVQVDAAVYMKMSVYYLKAAVVDSLRAFQCLGSYLQRHKGWGND